MAPADDRVTDEARRLTERFFALTPERVLAAVESAGRRATGYALALGSLENRVYDVELEPDGRSADGPSAHVVAKFYRPGRWSRAALLDEHRFLAELAEAEIPAVAPLPLDDTGRTLGEVRFAEGEEAGAGAAILFCLFPRVRGRPTDEPDAGQRAWLGRLLARLHTVGARPPGGANDLAECAARRGVLDADHYGRASLAALRDLGAVPEEVAARYFSVAERLVEACAARLAEHPAEAIRIHGDCHAGNLLWGRQGPFFLDFDDFLIGPAVQDVWLLCPGDDAEARARREDLLDGYEALRPFDRSTLALVEPLRALRIVRYAAWVARRYADPSFSRAFPAFRDAAFWERECGVLTECLARVRSAAPSTDR